MFKILKIISILRNCLYYLYNFKLEPISGRDILDVLEIKVSRIIMAISITDRKLNILNVIIIEK